MRIARLSATAEVTFVSTDRVRESSLADSRPRRLAYDGIRTERARQ